MESLNDIVALKNLDSVDFMFMYDKREYYIPAGQIKRFPRFLADHCLKHFIDYLITKNGGRTNNVDLRKEWAAKIVIEVETFDEPPRKSAADELDERVGNMNRKSDLDSILGRHREAVDQRPYQVKVDGKGQEIKDSAVVIEPPAPKTPPPAAPTTPAQPAKATEGADGGNDEFDGLSDPTQPKPGEPTAAPAAELPTKAQLLEYAVKVVGMTKTNDKGEVDKSWKTLERMTVPQLIKELQYPLPGEDE